jgi:hypothetical protein
LKGFFLFFHNRFPVSLMNQIYLFFYLKWPVA